MSDFERLDDTGLNFTDTGIDYSGTILSADYGSGYEDRVVVGLSVREWSMTADVLPDMEEYLINAGEHGGMQTRARYFWEFYQRQLDAGNKSFWIYDRLEKRDYLVKFVELRLTYQIFTSLLYSTGVTLRQRRERTVEGVTEQTEEVNTDAI